MKHQVGQWYVNGNSAPFLVVKTGTEPRGDYEDVLIIYKDRIVKSSWYVQDAQLTKPHFTPAVYTSLIINIWKYMHG